MAKGIVSSGEITKAVTQTISGGESLYSILKMRHSLSSCDDLIISKLLLFKITQMSHI
jgi:hypothetical protein